MNNVYLISRDYLVSLATKIRELTGTSTPLAPTAMLAALDALSAGGSDGGDLAGFKDEISYRLDSAASDGKIYFQPPLMTDLVGLITGSGWDDNLDQPADYIHGVSTKDITKLSLPLCAHYENTDSGSGSVSFANSKLQEVNLPALLEIPDSLFSNCASLTDVTLSACLAVPQYTFYGCTSLEEISLPACTSLGERAFQDCSSLETVSLPLCTSIGSEAFAGTAVETLELPALANFYADEYSSSPFQNAMALKSISLNGLSLLPSQAFEYNTTLEEISLVSCEEIYSDAFTGCTGLTSITLSTACSLNDNIFTDVLDPDNKIFKMYFVADSDGIIRGTALGMTLFSETDASEDSSYSSESGSGDENDIINSEAIPGLEIYVPGDLIERFKTEWCGGRYAENVLPMPDDS